MIMKPWLRLYRHWTDWRTGNENAPGWEVRFGALFWQAGLLVTWRPGFALWDRNYQMLVNANWC